MPPQRRHQFSKRPPSNRRIPSRAQPATPEHGFNTSADQRLQDYYGTVVAHYTLAEALNDGVLTPYEYYVHPVPLTHDEAEEYFDLSKRISMLLAQGTDVNDTENAYLDALLIARARPLGSAQQKRSVLDGVLQDIPPTPLTLFYCGDGRVTDDVSGEEIRQIDAVSHDLFERPEGFAAVHAAVFELLLRIDDQCRELSSGRRVEPFRWERKNDACILTSNSVGMIIRWQQPFINVLDKSVLLVEEYDGRLLLTSELNLMLLRTAEGLQRDIYEPELSRAREYGWRKEDEDTDFFTSAALAERCVIQFIDLLDRSARGECVDDDLI